MSRRYWPSMTACGFVSNLISITIVPNLRRADQPGIRSQRRQLNLHAVLRNQLAILPDHLAHAIEKQVCALHHTAAEYDDFRSKHGDEIGETKAQIVRLALHRALCPLLGALRPGADFAGIEITAAANCGRIFS